MWFDLKEYVLSWETHAGDELIKAMSKIEISENRLANTSYIETFTKENENITYLKGEL